MQEAIRQILEAIYEPIFSSHSHGFRPNRSCHTALKEIGNSFRGTIWFIEGDIKGRFDNIDHSVLLKLLSEKIDASDKKIAYVRYADDFLIGVNGTQEEAGKIKQELIKFTTERLKLELNDEKTKIVHTSEKVRFLGYDINVRRSPITKTTRNGIVRRTMNYSVDLTVPLKEIEKFLFEHKVVKQSQNGRLKPCHREYLVGTPDLGIIDTYNA